MQVYGLVERLLDAKNSKLRKDNLALSIKTLLDCVWRDRLSRERAEGCWCLGLGGKGELALDPIPPSTDYFMTVRVHCEACLEGQALKEQADVHQAQVMKYRPILERRRVMRSWPSDRYNDKSLSSYAEAVIAREGTLPEVNSQIIERLQAWCGLTKPTNLYIWGPPGVGKSGLMYICARTLLESGKMDVVVTTVSDILMHIQDTFGKHGPDDTRTEEVEQLYREVEYLFADDWGKENATAWALNRLWGIMNHRYNKKDLITVSTSEFSPESLGLIHSVSLVDRLVEGAYQISVPGPLIRGPM